MNIDIYYLTLAGVRINLETQGHKTFPATPAMTNNVAGLFSKALGRPNSGMETPDERAERLAVISFIIDRPISSTYDLFWGEAHTLIEFMKKPGSWQPDENILEFIFYIRDNLTTQKIASSAALQYPW
jgi:hypothetical protein